MSDDEPFKANQIFTEEMANAARAHLREKFVCQCREAPEGDTETVEEDQSVDLDHEDDEPYIDDLLPFTLSEHDLIERLISTIRRRMVSSAPETLRQIAAFLYALERLPYATPDLTLDLTVADRTEGNLSYVSVELDGQSFRLSTGGSIYSPGVGSDSFSETVFEIETGGFRDGSTDAFSDWLDAFASVGGTIEVQGDGDGDLTEPAPEDGWDRLEKYWDARGGDADDW